MASSSPIAKRKAKEWTKALVTESPIGGSGTLITLLEKDLRPGNPWYDETTSTGEFYSEECPDICFRLTMELNQETYEGATLTLEQSVPVRVFGILVLKTEYKREAWVETYKLSDLPTYVDGHKNLSFELMAYIQFWKPEFAFAPFLKDAEYADFEMRAGVGEEEAEIFRVHRIILAAASEPLHRLFLAEMKEKKTGIVNLPYPPAIVRGLLQFLYEGSEAAVKAEPQVFLDLAQQYQMKQLKDICLHFLIKSLKVENVLELAELGDRYGSEKLLYACEDLISEQRRRHRKATPKWAPEGAQDLEKRNPDLLKRLMEY